MQWAKRPDSLWTIEHIPHMRWKVWTADKHRIPKKPTKLNITALSTSVGRIALYFASSAKKTCQGKSILGKTSSWMPLCNWSNSACELNTKRSYFRRRSCLRPSASICAHASANIRHHNACHPSSALCIRTSLASAKAKLFHLMPHDHNLAVARPYIQRCNWKCFRLHQKAEWILGQVILLENFNGIGNSERSCPSRQLKMLCISSYLSAVPETMKMLYFISPTDTLRTSNSP